MSFMREADAEPLQGYRLIEPLGTGGFGEVWKCEAPGGLFKAIKFVYGNLNSTDMAGKRAEQELKALNRIKEVRHPFVLSLERLEIVDGELVIVMELADSSLFDCFEECRAAGRNGIPREMLLRYMRDAAEALDHMNEKHGLQHLDVKPRNLFLVSERVKVADFGLVKHLEQHSSSGVGGALTPLYGAPELYAGKITGTSDQYSLAIVYQELLTGQRPFDGKNPRQLAQQHMMMPPELRWLPEAEREVVGRALAKDPAARFPSCLAFIRALYSLSTLRAELILPDAPPAGADSPDQLEVLQFADRPEAEASQHPREGVAGSDAEHPELPAEEQAKAARVSELGMTQAQPETGSLRPTLVIGIGNFGRSALQELRCRFVDRFGELSRLPLLRFLYLETDAEAAQGSLRGSTSITLKPTEVCHLPLQPVVHYRRRQLEQLHDWLPREKLFAMPRSLKTQGSRALGRLAWVSNYLRLRSRLKHELQKAVHPDALFHTVNETGLALRDSTARVCVIASATGGSSGCLADLAYTLRRLFEQMRLPGANVTAFLFCGAPDDPAMSRSEQANVCATLTELNHYQDPTVCFSAQYGADGPTLSDSVSPFDAVYLLAMRNQTPAARRDILSQLSSYLFHEFATPLGLRLEQSRKTQEGEIATPFRSFGTYGVWFPRGLLVRLAARQACLSLLQQWQSIDEAEVQTEVQASCSRLLADHGLRPEALAARIEEAAARALEGKPADVLTRLLSSLEEQATQSLAHEDPGSWARQAVSRVKEWFGVSVSASQDESQPFGSRKSRFVRALQLATVAVADDWCNQLTIGAFGLSDLPGRRLSAVEAALGQMRQFLEEQKQQHQEQLREQAQRVERATEHLEKSLDACFAAPDKSWLFFGARASRGLRVLIDHLAALARQCLADDLLLAVHSCLSLIADKLNDRMGDLHVCRQRLRSLGEAIESGALDIAGVTDPAQGEEDESVALGQSNAETFWESLQQARTEKVILPDGEKNLERAAQRFVGTLGPEEWLLVDQSLQEQLLRPKGGLPRICLGNSNLTRSLGLPLLDRIAQLLDGFLPAMDVAGALGAEDPAAGEDLARQIDAAHAAAEPSIAGTGTPDETMFLLVPASPAGRAFGARAQQKLGEIQVVPGPAQSDLMFCREQGFLAPSTLQEVLEPLQGAYDEAVSNPRTSPHSRFDVAGWVPLYS
jgi:serine/threonine protein kinase